MREEETFMDLVQKALELGFTHAAPLDPKTLAALPEVREMCAADKCHTYGRNWTCPPECGTLEECEAQMRERRKGVLVQTVGELRSAFDAKGMLEILQRHQKQFLTLADMARAAWPDALCLGAGGCPVCPKCAWPEPCRFPDKACPSMEGYGLMDARVCKENGLAAHYGKGTLTYVACVLYDTETA